MGAVNVGGMKSSKPGRESYLAPVFLSYLLKVQLELVGVQARTLEARWAMFHRFR